jgi:hypothetical protein
VRRSRVRLSPWPPLRATRLLSHPMARAGSNGSRLDQARTRMRV